jgi:translocator protein
MEKRTKLNIWKLIVSIVICQLAGLVGSFFTFPAVSTWYLTLNKPSFNPPSWLFGPVWTFLFLLMGISIYLIWTKGPSLNNSKAFEFFIIQLVLNILWSVLFFGLHSPLAAFIEIILLWIAILLTIIYSFKVSKSVSYLLIPYILWVTFASVLNLSIYLLNR